MAGRALTPAGVILKWILIPAALLAIGFFLIGSKIGNVLPGIGGGSPVTATPVAEGSAAQKYNAPDVDVQSDRKLSAPEVEVSSRKKSSRRRPRSHPTPGD